MMNVEIDDRRAADAVLALGVTGSNGDIVEEGVCLTSATTGEGIPELRAEILKHAAGEGGAQQESGFLTNVRHQQLVDDSLKALEAASSAVRSNTPHEMILLDLYHALRPLDSITGETTADDILNLIFSSFCIGK